MNRYFEKHLRNLNFLGWLLILFVPSAIADVQSMTLFTLQPQATVFQRSDRQTNDYIVPLDVYKKRDNRWVPESFQREQGRLLALTLELPRDYNEKEVFDYYLQQLPKEAVKLFSCQARDCAESNNWANDHFGVKQLYGTDASQWLAVFRLPATSVDTDVRYVTIYTVRRGNRRLYTQLEVLSATPT